MSKQAAVYVRVSTEAQAGEDRVSIPEQARELLALAKARGWELVEPPPFTGREKLPAGVFGEPGLSGDTIEARPGMLALLDAVRGSTVDVVLVRDTNRLSRKPLAAEQIHDVLERHGVLLVTPAMDYDYSNLQHRLMLGLLGNIDAYAKAWLVENMRKAREAMGKKGRFSVAQRPYGFRWDGARKVPVVIEEEAETVKLIFSLSAKGRTVREVAEELNRRALRPRESERWCASHVARVVGDRRYAGEWIAWTDPETGEQYPASPDLAPQALVSARAWARAQASSAHHKRHPRRKLQASFLLAGSIYCECGAPMIGKAVSGSPAYRFYGCTKYRGNGSECKAHYLPAEAVEERVWGLVERLIEEPGLVAKYAARTEKQDLPSWREEVERLDRAIGGCEKQVHLAMVAYETGDYTLDEFADRKAALTRDLEAWRQRRGEVASWIEGAGRRAEGVARVVEIAQEIAENQGCLEKLDLDGRRNLLRLLDFHVTAGADDWGKRGANRTYRLDIAWAGEAFLDRELAVVSGLS